MKKTTLFALPLLALTLQLTGCTDKSTDPPSAEGIHYGAEAKLGGGTVRSFVATDASGNPTETGIAVSEAAMNSLPSAMAELVLELPAQGSKTPFKHMLVDYMPHGHEPDGIYNVPHFDFHFYKISSAERLTILPDKVTELSKDPEAAYLPAGYVKANPVPTMGVHWIDPTSGEFQGKPFTSTFIYGAYNGQVIFYEPMVTVDFIKKTQHQHFTVKQPQKVSPAGYYPEEYCVRYNATDKQYEIVLESMKLRQ